MTNYVNSRVLEIADYILKTKATVRATAKIFSVSKSTVHNDIHIRLKKLDSTKFKKISQIMQFNFDEKHLRGGLATKRKYAKNKINKI